MSDSSRWRALRSGPFGSRRVVGRLVEVWANRVTTASEVKALAGHFASACPPRPAKSIVCADYRGLGLLSPSVCDAWIEAFGTINILCERSALIIPALPMHALQFQTIMQGAEHPYRRLFTDIAGAKAWLSLALDATERERLERFLQSDDG
jgi:hypothetical protein